MMLLSSGIEGFQDSKVLVNHEILNIKLTHQCIRPFYCSDLSEGLFYSVLLWLDVFQI